MSLQSEQGSIFLTNRRRKRNFSKYILNLLLNKRHNKGFLMKSWRTRIHHFIFNSLLDFFLQKTTEKKNSEHEMQNKKHLKAVLSHYEGWLWRRKIRTTDLQPELSSGGFIWLRQTPPPRGSSPSKSQETEAVGTESLRGPYRHRAGKPPRPLGFVEPSLGLSQMDRIWDRL